MGTNKSRMSGATWEGERALELVDKLRRVDASRLSITHGKIGQLLDSDARATEVMRLEKKEAKYFARLEQVSTTPDVQSKAQLSTAMHEMYVQNLIECLTELEHERKSLPGQQAGTFRMETLSKFETQLEDDQNRIRNAIWSRVSEVEPHTVAWLVDEDKQPAH